MLSRRSFASSANLASFVDTACEVVPSVGSPLSPVSHETRLATTAIATAAERYRVGAFCAIDSSRGKSIYLQQPPGVLTRPPARQPTPRCGATYSAARGVVSILVSISPRNRA